MEELQAPAIQTRLYMITVMQPYIKLSLTLTEEDLYYTKSGLLLHSTLKVILS